MTRSTGSTRRCRRWSATTPWAQAIAIRDAVTFFQAVRAALFKQAAPGARAPEDLDLAVRQLVSRALAPDGVVDIFAAAGLEKPDLSILSDEFLAEIQRLPQKNLAVELARELNRARRRGEELGLSEDELAFYDALEVNDNAVKILGDEALRTIARELVKTVRTNVSIDWHLKESVRARLRIAVKRVLRRYGYPPDKQERATQTVLEQAEQFGDGWLAEPFPKPTSPGPGPAETAR